MSLSNNNLSGKVVDHFTYSYPVANVPNTNFVVQQIAVANTTFFQVAYADPAVAVYDLMAQHAW